MVYSITYYTIIFTAVVYNAFGLVVIFCWISSGIA
uniref:Uncharacterized protein n=1 Tax=Rhizophora mucronata TaxID=61149 RepID=A0A2P2R4F3_RHIMU